MSITKTSWSYSSRTDFTPTFNCLMARTSRHSVRSVDAFPSMEKLQKPKLTLGVLKEHRKQEEKWNRRIQDAKETMKRLLP